MTNFTVYTFQFGPIVPAPGDLQFPIEFDPDKVMENKNETFEKLFEDLDNLAIYETKDSTTPLPIEAVRNKEIIMFYLGDPTPITIVKKDGKVFYNKQDTTNPYCMVIIDNRSTMQRIFIQGKKGVFNSNTDRIAEMLQRSFNRVLSKDHLYIEIGHEYPPVAFWNYIKSQPQGIKSVKLWIPFPNLPRVAETVDQVDDVFEKMNSDFHSSMMIQIDAAEGGILTGLDENDPRLKYFLEANAKCGKYAMVKAAGRRAYYPCGKKDHLSQPMDDKVAGYKANDFNGDMFGDEYKFLLEQIADQTRLANL